ncbi:AMP-binding enzyme family protein [Mycobacterium ulcerans str. Harvey]|uniref:AMP-binding enzyme family protein n=1 Tax=Mycobacterium ulcerans str. Harvey TaxID=1299332 RepID=A0ABN0QXH9_MYCUL|nr:AMP-binding enzyme family protein [Mycobacterium ulcerans str. Harvey]
MAARSDTVYDWMASRGSGRDAANRLREIVDELAADTSVNNFHDLGRLGGWAILAAVAPQGSATQALIERGWRFERTKVGGRNEHASGYEQALPAYADAVGTLDEFLAGDAEVDPALHPLRRREAEPIVGPRRPGGDHSIHELVAAQIERIPQAIAIEDVHGATVTYAELGERVDAFAEHLAAAGVRPGDAIGVFLGRSVHLAVAALAIARSGVVVVVNPTHPSARVADMITDAGVSRVVVDDQTRPLVPVNAPELIAADRAGAAVASMPPPQLDPAEPAYLNFTSGSTGRPKAVTSSHRAFCNQLLWRRDEFGLGGDDALLQTAAPTFDIFMWEIFGPLVAGARLVFNPGEWDPHSIVQRVRQSSITMLQIVPSQLDVLLEEPDLGQCMTLRYVFCGGEPLSLALCRRFAAVLPHAELVNLYGPTETTIDATFWRVEVADEASWAPTGRPIANACLYVVDPEGALAAPGAKASCGSAVPVSRWATSAPRPSPRSVSAATSAARIPVPGSIAPVIGYAKDPTGRWSSSVGWTGSSRCMACG